MSDDLKVLLSEIGIGLLTGLALGLVVRRRQDWCRQWAKFVLDGQWKLFALGAVFFGLGAIGCWRAGKIPHAVASGAMCALELFCMLRYLCIRLMRSCARSGEGSP